MRKKRFVKYYEQYRMHRLHARHRGIPWEFTYVSWCLFWAESGHLHERGRKRGQYCMARFNDEGLYSPSNVKIITVGANVSEAQIGWSSKSDSKTYKKRIKKTSKTLTGRKQSASHKKNRLAAHSRYWKRIKAEAAQPEDQAAPL